MTVYIASIKVIHSDLYEQDDDGTFILGVFANRDDAVNTIKTRYKDDKLAALERDGSEINEDETYDIYNEDIYGEEAYYYGCLRLQYESTKEFDMSSEYKVRPYEVK